MEWISPNQGKILSEIEGKVIEPIEIEISGSNNYEITKVSGNFPNGISLVENNGSYSLQGTLDLVEETTEYYFTLQAKDLDTEEYIQRWFSMNVETLDTKWDDENKINFEEYEKTYFSYQFKLKNPERNEIFKKISGELPEGLNLSETGLLYGVPEEDREKEYNFKIGIFRNEILQEDIITPVIKIKIDDLSLLNKPIWVTSEGIISYVNYDDNVNIQLVAYDTKGREIKYRCKEKNLPDNLSFDDNGIISGTCKTNFAKTWSIDVQPYIVNISEGDWRTFQIITNSQLENNKIDWITEELDNTKIGYPYSFQLKTKSKLSVKYQIVSGNLPDGLTMDNNGNIYGITNYQNIGEYSFIIRAYNDIAFSIKEFTINVEKGLSQNTVDVYLNINKEHQQEYQEIISKYDISSKYNPLNPMYKIDSFPKINICSLNTWDNVLLKYKLSQFNTPIDIIWKETKKKSFENVDFFYKDFNEVNKYTENLEFKIHENDTIYEDRYGNEFIPGYIRESIDGNELEIKYYKLGDDKNPESEELGEEITDIENIKKEVNEIRTNYYYVNPDNDDEYLIHDPVYYYQGIMITKEEFMKIYNYIDYGNSFVLDENNNKIYIEPIEIGRFYETESKRIVNLNEIIYVKPENNDDTIIYKKYILKYDEESDEEVEIEVSIIDKEGQYCSFNPIKNKENEFKYIDISKYGSIQNEEKIDHYYKFNSPTIPCKTSSINGIREAFTQPFNVEKYEGKLWYKVSNQEIINDDFIGRKFTIKYNKEEDYYYIENLSSFRVYKKIDENSYTQVFANIGDDSNPDWKPVVIRTSSINQRVNWLFYMVYPEGTEVPLTNSLFETDFEWDKGSKYICELNDDGYYEWFKVKQAENPYIYYASNNTKYGYDKDIVLPYVSDDNVKDGQVTFLDLEIEKDLLPDYMEEISNDEKIKIYNPTLPLFYAIPNSQNAILQNINAYEKQGHYWYGKKFVFFELNFSPRYKKDIDNFTILFYNSVNENVPRFLLI